MEIAVETMDLLARIMRYPEPELATLVGTAVVAFAEAEEFEFSCALQKFAESCGGYSDVEISEIFTRTFDMSAQCALELGWHLFGESYDRGLYLVWMREKLREFGVAESTDLPDHLSYALRILARLEDEDAGEFARLCILPALLKIEPGFKDDGNPFQPLVKAVAELLTKIFGPAVVDTKVSLPMYEQHEELFSKEGV